MNDISREIASLMRECVDETDAELEQRARAAGKRAVSMLKQQSRQRTGKYKKGWRADVTADETGVECAVHNRVYQLTHLLESGHRSTNQTGRDFGTVPGDGVIARVAELVGNEFMGGAG